jgi:hypothetical protein
MALDVPLSLEPTPVDSLPTGKGWLLEPTGAASAASSSATASTSISR